MKKYKKGRHAPAFALLFLSKRAYYGYDLYKEMNDRLLDSNMDTAAVYRVLNKLEEEGYASFEWENINENKPKKVYSITKKGLTKLDEYKNEIEKIQKNFNFFMEHYKKDKVGGNE